MRIARLLLAFVAPAMTCLTWAAATGPESIKIGNYYVFAPNGIAFIAKDASAFVIDPGGQYFAGQSTPDNAFHSTQITLNGSNVHFEWGRVGDAVVGKFTSDRDVNLPIKLFQPWPTWKTIFSSHGAAWQGVSDAPNARKWSIFTDPPLQGSNPNALTLVLKANLPCRIVAGFDTLPKLSNVDDALIQKNFRFNLHSLTSTGDWGNFAGAISNNLGNSRIYSNDDHRIAISVSRRWADGPNNEPYFCWDSFFNGALSSLDDPITARDTVRAILSWQTAEGLVPNFGHWNFNSGRISKDRSQPPVGALCVWKMHQRWPNPQFLAEVYPKLLKWHRWWPTARDGRHDGLLEWGSSEAGKQGALWETGWDDTVEYEGADMKGSTLNAYAVDLNSLWAMDADYLATIADALGKRQDAIALRAERQRTLHLINSRLWNAELGVYCSRLWSGPFLTRLTPMNFYPLLAGAADPDRAKKVLRVLKDPALFWGQWILPTVAYNDPVWHEQDYWKGKVWAPVNYLIWQGLQQYADPETLGIFADKSVDLFMRNWNAKGVCGENYLSSTGEQSSDPHYTWGSLLCLIGIESLCQIDRDGSILLNGTQNRTLTLNNLPLHGKFYRLQCSPHRTELFSGKRSLAVAQNKILRLNLQ